MTTTAEVFWRKVNRNGDNECWPWMGYRNVGKRSAGYGRIDFQGAEGVYAHRVAYFLAHPGKINLRRGKGPFVLHECDNPRCCNPRHLFLGTHLENMRDMRSKNRSHAFLSTESPNAVFSEEDVRHIRYLKSQGATKNAIALLYDVSVSCIGHCIYGLSYRDVY